MLQGIEYLQSVGTHQPVTPMHIMVHPLQPLSPEEAFRLAADIFGEALSRKGELSIS